MPPKKRVDAKVVEVDKDIQPIDAVVVGDKRPSLGRRLGIFALVIVLLFFAINTYIQSAKNGAAVRHAATHDSKKSKRLLKNLSNLSHSNSFQTDLIQELQDALRRQNKLLEEHGIKTVVIPGDTSSGSGKTPSKNNSNGNNQGSNGTSKHHHHHKPGNNPPPDKGPVEKTTDRICELTGLCVTQTRSNYVRDYQLEGLRCPQVYCASGTPSLWSVIFRFVANLGSVAWR